jgi:hypothetical protein
MQRDGGMNRFTLWLVVAISVYGRAFFGSNKVRIPLAGAFMVIMVMGLLARLNPALAGS